MAWTWRFEKMDGTPATARDLPKNLSRHVIDAGVSAGV